MPGLDQPPDVVGLGLIGAVGNQSQAYVLPASPGSRARSEEEQRQDPAAGQHDAHHRPRCGGSFADRVASLVDDPLVLGLIRAAFGARQAGCRLTLTAALFRHRKRPELVGVLGHEQDTPDGDGGGNDKSKNSHTDCWSHVQ